MPAYSGYQTAAEFDAGYANNITPDVVAHWEGVMLPESAQVLADLPHHADVRYGPRELNTLDFFPAPGVTGPAPTLFVIHGGLWYLSDKAMTHFLARAFTARGVHVATINYTLAPHAGLGEIVAECRLAARHVYERAIEWKIDRTRFSVLGHSAAGQLCTMTAAADYAEEAPGLPSQLFRACIGVSGFYDTEPFAQTHFQEFTRFVPDDYRTWNPLRHVSAHLPPMQLITGARESSLLQQMMAHYAAALSGAKVPVETTCAEGECHFSVLHEIGNPASPLFRRVLQAIA
jgi:arylformamidase